MELNELSQAEIPNEKIITTFPGDEDERSNNKKSTASPRTIKFFDIIHVVGSIFSKELTPKEAE